MGVVYVIAAAIYALFSTFGINLAGGESYKTYTMQFGNSSEQVLDIFIPESAYDRDYNGVIMYVHGGSWTGGTRKARPTELMTLVGEGYIGATLDYTVHTSSNKATVFDMMDDITTALNKIKEFTDEKELNVTKLCLTGYSAGGHIGALYAYTRAEESPIELVLLSNRVGPADFRDNIWGDQTVSLVSMLSGQKITEEMIKDGSADEAIISVSPAAFVNENSVPTIAGYGGTDMVVNPGNGKSMEKALSESGIDYTFIWYPNSGHMLLFNPGSTNKFNKVQDDYLQKYFGY